MDDWAVPSAVQRYRKRQGLHPSPKGSLKSGFKIKVKNIKISIENSKIT